MPVKVSQAIETETRLEELLAKAGARDRVNIEKHLAACDAEADTGHALLWRRLTVKLSQLAPLALTTIGMQVVRFFIADGKYRMQVFALEDNGDGVLAVYLPNVLASAISAKLLVKNGGEYSLASAPEEVLTVEQMDVNNPSNPPDFIKHMTGWNRKAVKLTLQANEPDSARVNLIESLCELAARQWATASR
ncbi:MAG TPA: hypothetical protein VMD30_06710 [Tepidisphaeraceae bacterium]|nr:hypothetical protein [Tepidisphaeraceae bacterium]